MPWRYEQWPQSHWPRGGAHTDMLAVPLNSYPETSAVTCRIARYLRRLPYPQTGHKIFTHRRIWVRVLSPCQETSYFVCSRNRKIRTVLYLQKGL